MNTSTDLNKIVIYTPHANLRMNQRAITKELIEFIIEYADKRAYVSKDKKGEEHHFISKEKISRLLSRGIISRNDAEKLKGLYIIVIIGFIDPVMRFTVLTVCHQTETLTRKLAKHQKRQDLFRERRRKMKYSSSINW